MDLITLTDPSSPISEAYRSLRTNLSFYSVDDPIRTLVVTSPAPDEAQPVALANLAVTLAQGGQKTLLVDCDLRRPSMHTFFGGNNDKGFTNLVLDEESALPIQSTEVENLSLLASGPKPPNPADLLGSKQTDKVIERLMETADIILFNAPPIIAVTDAAVLGTKVDGVLLIVTAGKTRRDHAEKAKDILAKANARVIGAALTNAPKDGSIGDFYG